jgi:hypothetical protein
MLNRDPDARLKRHFQGAGEKAELPEYRYVLTYGAIPPSQVGAIEEALPYFVVADGHSRPAQ